MTKDQRRFIKITKTDVKHAPNDEPVNTICPHCLKDSLVKPKEAYIVTDLGENTTIVKWHLSENYEIYKGADAVCTLTPTQIDLINDLKTLNNGGL